MVKRIRIIFFLPIFWGLTFVFSVRTAVTGDLEKVPIFFVHGREMSSDCWNHMIKYLERNGYPRNYLETIQLIPNDGPNIDAAERQIAPAIEKFLNKINAVRNPQHIPRQPLTKVDLISHSMGALSSRWYAAKIRPDRVRMWISIGGPNHGTNEACKYKSLGAKDSCPAYAKSKNESYIQYELNGDPFKPDVDETPYGIGKDSLGVGTIYPDEKRRILYITIRTFPDKFIKPEDSAILDGAGGIKIVIPKGVRAEETSPGNILMKNKVDHDEMLYDKEVMELVKTILALHCCPN